MHGMSAHADQLLKRIEDRTAKIGIVGLGYVGLPLSKALLENGYSVIGFDVDTRKIKAIEAGLIREASVANENARLSMAESSSRTSRFSGGAAAALGAARMSRISGAAYRALE